jgi:hypothetical protein
MTRPVDNLTLAVLRSAELGFFGFVMPTFRHTPLSEGAPTWRRAGETALRARWATRQPCGERKPYVSSRSRWDEKGDRRERGMEGGKGDAYFAHLVIGGHVVRAG